MNTTAFVNMLLYKDVCVLDRTQGWTAIGKLRQGVHHLWTGGDWTRFDISHQRQKSHHFLNVNQELSFVARVVDSKGSTFIPPTDRDTLVQPAVVHAPQVTSPVSRMHLWRVHPLDTIKAAPSYSVKYLEGVAVSLVSSIKTSTLAVRQGQTSLILAGGDIQTTFSVVNSRRWVHAAYPGKLERLAKDLNLPRRYLRDVIVHSTPIDPATMYMLIALSNNELTELDFPNLNVSGVSSVPIARKPKRPIGGFSKRAEWFISQPKGVIAKCAKATGYDRKFITSLVYGAGVKRCSLFCAQALCDFTKGVLTPTDWPLSDKALAKLSLTVNKDTKETM